MSKSLRAQVSLIFTDEDLFDNFVTPLKENKELSGTITKLLSAYYNSTEVQELVEGVSLRGALENEEQSDSTEMFSKMRQTLAMQDYLFEQVKQTLDDGTSDMDVLMKANDLAKQSGVVKTESTDVGEVVTQFKLEDSTLKQKSEQVTEPENSSNLEGRVEKIESTLNELLSLMKAGQGITPNTAMQDTTSNVNTEDVPKTESLSSVTQVPVVEETKESFISEVQSSSTPTTPEKVEIVEDVINQEVVKEEEDASDVLKDALADLLDI